MGRKWAWPYNSLVPGIIIFNTGTNPKKNINIVYNIETEPQKWLITFS